MFVDLISASHINARRELAYHPHKQTEQLFKHGKITSAQPRGKALAEGTAFSSGSGSITGGGSTTTRPSGSGSGSEDSDDNSTIIDWIEIAIDRIERAINRLGSIAQSGYKALAKRLRADDDQIQKVIQEIDLQNKAYARYNKEAEAVGLSSELKLKVQNGTIDINEYDEETSKLIEDYQKWYEKALDCADAIDELHESLASLWEEKFNTVLAVYDVLNFIHNQQTDMIQRNLTHTANEHIRRGTNAHSVHIVFAVQAFVHLPQYFQQQSLHG